MNKYKVLRSVKIYVIAKYILALDGLEVSDVGFVKNQINI